MFLVFNKEKVYAYIVSVITVCCLFFIAGLTTPKTVETSGNTINQNNNILNITNNVNVNNTVKFRK